MAFDEFGLAALWQDIGKFKQRAGWPEDTRKGPREIGADWLEKYYGPGLIASLAGREPPSSDPYTANLAVILDEARRGASRKTKHWKLVGRSN